MEKENYLINKECVFGDALKTYLSALQDNYFQKISRMVALPMAMDSIKEMLENEGYTLDHPMTNDEFRDMAENPNNLIEIEKIKTGYTNLFLEHQKMDGEVKNGEKELKFIESQILYFKKYL